MCRPLLLFLLALPSEGIFFGGSGGGCGCAPSPPCPKTCAPPPPPPPCPPPRPCATARGVITHREPGSPSELDLRAAALGVVPLSNNEDTDSTQLLLIERLGELANGALSGDATAQTVSSPDIEKAVAVDDSDLHGGLVRKGGSEVRRHPGNRKAKKEALKGKRAAKMSGSAEDRIEKALRAKKEDKKSPKRQIDSSTEAPAVSPASEEISKCNSQVLKKIMLDNMKDNSAEAKRDINIAAETLFGGNVDVICSRGHFSYVFSSNLYCEAQKGLLTCIAFRQAV